MSRLYFTTGVTDAGQKRRCSACTACRAVQTLAGATSVAHRPMQHWHYSGKTPCGSCRSCSACISLHQISAILRLPICGLMVIIGLTLAYSFSHERRLSPDGSCAASSLKAMPGQATGEDIMTKHRLALACLILCALLTTACSSKGDFEGRISSYNYQAESLSVTPGHNLYRHDTLDTSTSQRVNQFSRSYYMHDQQQDFVRRLSAAQALDKEAQKLGREPGSLFRQ